MTAFLPGLWLKGRMGLSLGSGGGYLGKLRGLFGSSIVGLWPQNEASGTVSREIVNGYNGQYTGVTLGVPGIGDGNTAASYDGTTSFNNVYSAALAAAFNPNELSLIAWVKTSAWADSTFRVPVSLAVNSSNKVFFQKSTVSNRLDANYIAGGTTKTITSLVAAANTGWLNLAMTVSKSADALIGYLNGVPIGSPQTGLGTWVGSLAATLSTIGAENTSAGKSWNGYESVVCLLNRRATPAEIAQTAIVP